jgi:hypothetical protein
MNPTVLQLPGPLRWTSGLLLEFACPWSRLGTPRGPRKPNCLRKSNPKNNARQLENLDGTTSIDH